MPASDDAAPTSARAWTVCWMMFAATALTYVDRQALALLREPIKDDFGITSDTDFGWVLSAFYLTYALLQVPAGYLVDRRDLRKTYAMAVAWWSLAAAATAIAPGFGALIACRALLGVGESFNWPVALRVTGRILPPSDRGLGNGIFNSGAAIGTVIAPAIVTYLAYWMGWRSSFVAIGGLGFVWVFAWLAVVQGDQRRAMAPEIPKEPTSGLPGPVISAFVGTWIVAAVVAASGFIYGPKVVQFGIATAIVGPLVVATVFPSNRLEGAPWSVGLGRIVRNRRFWVLVAVSVSINICWHFQVNWVPSYLKDDRKLKFEVGNYLSMIPFVAADVGNLFGGWLSRHFALRGRSPERARLMVMGSALPMIMLGVLVGMAPNLVTAIVLLSVIALGTTAFMANYFAFTQEVSTRHTGLVVGYLGALGNLAVAGFQPFAGFVKDVTGTYALNFVIIGLAPIVGLAVLITGWGTVASNKPDGDSELA